MQPVQCDLPAYVSQASFHHEDPRQQGEERQRQRQQEQERDSCCCSGSASTTAASSIDAESVMMDSDLGGTPTMEAAIATREVSFFAQLEAELLDLISEPSATTDARFATFKVSEEGPAAADAGFTTFNSVPHYGSSCGTSGEGIVTHRTDGVAPQVRKRVLALVQQGVTTLMLRNVPPQLTQRQLVQKLRESGFDGMYDFVYLPSCFDSKAHSGYAFVNLVTPTAAGALASAWDLTYVLDPSPEHGALNISAAAVQGLAANIKRWSKKVQRIRNPDLRPYTPSLKKQATEQDAFAAPWPVSAVDLLPPPCLELPLSAPAASTGVVLGVSVPR